MDLVTFLRVLLRRWDVVLPGLLLTAVTVIAAGSSVASVHEAQGSLLLLGPSTSNSSQGAVPTNPYLNIPSSLSATAVIIAESMSSEETKHDLANLGATADYELKPTEKTPILTITAEGSSSEQVLQTADLVLQRVKDDLARRQLEAGAPEQTLIRSEVLSTPQVTKHAGNKPRVMTAVGALGVGTTLMLAFAVENLAAWLTRRRQGETTPFFAAPTLADMPLVSSEPAPHPEPGSEAANGNGWQPQPAAWPLVDLAVEPADPSPYEDLSERVTFEEVPEHNVASENNGSVEQQDGLVDAWWTAWERRQAGRRAQGPLVEPKAQQADENRAWQAEEAGNENEDAAATTSPPATSDDDEEANPRLDEGSSDALPQPDQAESVVAWGGDIEVLGGTPRVERETPSTWPYPAGGDGFADRPGT